VPRGGEERTKSAVATVVAPQATLRVRRKWAWGGASLVASAVAAAAIYIPLNRPTTAPSTTTTSAVPPSARDEIIVTVRAQPVPATIAIDDESPQENPFSQRRRADHATHRVTVRAPGFVTKTQSVRFDDDLSIRIALDPEDGSGADAGNKAAGHR
jgi:hypothetical protein